MTRAGTFLPRPQAMERDAGRVGEFLDCCRAFRNGCAPRWEPPNLLTAARFFDAFGGDALGFEGWLRQMREVGKRADGWGLLITRAESWRKEAAHA